VDQVATDGDSVETGTDGLATALINFAAEVRAFKSRFHSLRGGATAMRNKINDDEDWQDDEELVEEHNALLDEVNTLNGEWLEAQLECANTISALFDGPNFTTYDGMEGDGYSGNEIPFGFSEIPEGMEMPWGNPQSVSKHWSVDAWDGVADIGIGFAQDVGGVTGLWHDGKWGVPIFGEQGRSNFTNYMEENLEGLSLLTGFYDPTKPEGQQWGVEDFGEWVDNFVPAIREVGQGIVPTDEWDDRKGYVLSQATVNIGLIVGGIALSLTGVGAPAGVPMLLAGLRTGLRGANNVGTMDIPNFHNDTSFHLPGVPNIDLSRINSGSWRSGGNFWNSLPGGAWLADIGETVRNLNNSSSPNENPPAPSRTTNEPNTPDNDRKGKTRGEFKTDDGGRISEIKTYPGQKDSWNPELTTPRNNTKYKVEVNGHPGHHYHYETDSSGKARRAYGELRQIPSKDKYRHDSQQSGAGNDGREHYSDPNLKDVFSEVPWNGGHFFGTSFGGSGQTLNLFPQLEWMNQNRGSKKWTQNFYAMEDRWRAKLATGHRVDVDMEVVPSPGGGPPKGLRVRHWIGGREQPAAYYQNRPPLQEDWIKDNIEEAVLNDLDKIHKKRAPNQ
jgi:hypothetical protein